MIRTAACAIITNVKGELLIVKPTYRDDWLLPGGCIEDNESPSLGCEREILEEIGLDLKVRNLSCIEYQSGHGKKTESIQYIFDAGMIDKNQIDQIKLQESELVEYRFLDFSESKELLNTLLVKRLKYAFIGIEQNRIVYIEDKEEIFKS